MLCYVMLCLVYENSASINRIVDIFVFLLSGRGVLLFFSQAIHNYELNFVCLVFQTTDINKTVVCGGGAQ